jgi:hypothetical protein
VPIYFLGAGQKELRGLPEPRLRALPIDDTATHMKKLAEIDTCAVGVVREKHHRYLLSEAGTTGVMLYADSDCVGYSYVNANGHVGPLAVSQADVLGDAFATALKIAADKSSEKISAFVPGTCDRALSLAINQGMRITFPMLLMASPGYGTWTQYLPRNPGFM